MLVTKPKRHSDVPEVQCPKGVVCDGFNFVVNGCGTVALDDVEGLLASDSCINSGYKMAWPADRLHGL